jgi:hypothetical protein
VKIACGRPSVDDWFKARQVRPSFFEKKEAKKILLTWTVLVETPGAQFAEVFWLLFFKKVTTSLLLY